MLEGRVDEEHFRDERGLSAIEVVRGQIEGSDASADSFERTGE